MKKVLMFAAALAAVAAISGCGSFRTPKEGKYNQTVYYSTFFGISLESAIYGDGLIVNPMGK